MKVLGVGCWVSGVRYRVSGVRDWVSGVRWEKMIANFGLRNAELRRGGTSEKGETRTGREKRERTLPPLAPPYKGGEI